LSDPGERTSSRLPASELNGCSKIVQIMRLLTCLFLLISTCVLSQSADEFYTRLNKMRRNRLLPELTIDPKLEASSAAWIKKTKGKLMHDYSNNYGEVLGRCVDSIDCWMESKPHKKTMLRRKYRFVGYAIVEIDGIKVTCARFR